MQPILSSVIYPKKTDRYTSMMARLLTVIFAGIAWILPTVAEVADKKGPASVDAGPQFCLRCFPADLLVRRGTWLFRGHERRLGCAVKL